MVRPGGKAKSVHGPLEQPGDLGGGPAIAPQLAGPHLTVVVDPLKPGKSRLLHAPGTGHSTPNCGTLRFSHLFLQVLEGDRSHRDMEIDSVQEGT